MTSPQWSPVTRTGKSSRSPFAPLHDLQSRNGARSRGPGRAEGWACETRPGMPPQWSPVTRTGKSAHAVAHGAVQAGLPQWSPVTRTGKSPRPAPRRGRARCRRNGARSRGPGRGGGLTGLGFDRNAAAMEPGHEDREEPRRPGSPAAATARRNGARSRGPGRGGHLDRVAGLRGIAAMEPGHEDREESPPDGAGRAASAGRNGARSRGPGRGGGRGTWPRVGRRRRNGARSRGPGRAASWASSSRMPSGPQWSPVTRTGKSGHDCRCHGDRRRRNGARSRGPGRALHSGEGAVDDLAAAMEPGHEDREEQVAVRRHGRPEDLAAMEPGHEDREEFATRRCWPSSVNRPQWSPVTRTGKSPRRPLRRVGVGAAAMEPGHEDREELDRVAAVVPDEVAAMEPGHEDREECQKPGMAQRRQVTPQWSPVTRTGKRT